MTTYRKIDISDLRREVGELPQRNVGAPPALIWIDIKNLVIDPEYQRDLLKTGRRNIIKIAVEFDWSKFSTVIVAAIGRGRFAIVDGQHRVTAAALRGIAQVPCQIIEVDRKGQAAAFAAINAVVTAMSSLQIHAAKVIAGEKSSVALAKVCDESDVRICRYPVSADKMKPGDTLAASALYRALDRYGCATLVLALKCITKTRDGNPGLIRAHIVRAFCVVLSSEPSWASDGERLLTAMQSFDLKGAFRRARMSEGNIQTNIVGSVASHLAREMKVAA